MKHNNIICTFELGLSFGDFFPTLPNPASMHNFGKKWLFDRFIIFLKDWRDHHWRQHRIFGLCNPTRLSWSPRRGGMLQEELRRKVLFNYPWFQRVWSITRKGSFQWSAALNIVFLTNQWAMVAQFLPFFHTRLFTPLLNRQSFCLFHTPFETRFLPNSKNKFAIFHTGIKKTVPLQQWKRNVSPQQQ